MAAAACARFSGRAGMPVALSNPAAPVLRNFSGILRAIIIPCGPGRIIGCPPMRAARGTKGRGPISGETAPSTVRWPLTPTRETAGGVLAVLLSPMLLMERVALVAPATLPAVALLAPAGDTETL